jgi:uncharacterized membrane protein YgaE (UPF0421/DUF939 family)
MPATQTSQGSTASVENDDNAVTAKLQYAAKTALSLVLAYLIPMSMGWPQPQTAAITVMLIAATGLVADSLQKGVMRVIGTVVGAVIGLTLIALFPQDRMAYLLAVSVTISLLAYLYAVYRGDNTVFMLTIVVTLMVFNGGDAEGAFLYGVDRAFMTAFGVIVYTVVANTLWPVKAVDNTRQLATQVTRAYRRAFSRMAHPLTVGPSNNDGELAELLSLEEAFQVHFNQVKATADRVAAYRAEWDAVLACFEQLQVTLLPALRMEGRQQVAFDDYLENYPTVVQHIETIFEQLEAKWRDQQARRDFELVPAIYIKDSLRAAPHLTVAAVASRAELLAQIQRILLELDSALDSLLFDRGNFAPGPKPRGKPAFNWRDLEAGKTALRMFTTFWMATALWIVINPPGGFTFVTLCSVLVLMVSYTPASPKVLFILFSMGFLCALPAYVFLLPQLTHWLELAGFMFAYAFVGFFLFQGPVSLFFLFGMFALGIQNTMSYNVDLILLIMLTFYLMFTLLIVTVHFPFTSKPERLYASLGSRFFRQCGALLELAGDYRTKPARLPADDGSALLTKLHSWGQRIDTGYFQACDPQQITRFNQSCDLLQGQLQVLLMRREEFTGNRLISAHHKPGQTGLLVQLCHALAQPPGRAAYEAFDRVEERVASLGELLKSLRELPVSGEVERAELAQFFVYLNLQATVLACLHACREAREALPWKELTGKRF